MGSELEILQRVTGSFEQGIYDLDLRSGKVLINETYSKMLGYDPTKYIETYDHWQSMIHPHDREKALLNFENAKKGITEKYTNEFRMKTADEGYKWILSKGEFLEFDNNGKPTRLIGSHIDINEMKEYQNILVNNETKYKALYENTPLAYQSLDINGNIIDVNPSWLKNLNYKKEEVIGKWFGDFLFNDSVDHFRVNFPRFKRKGSVKDVQFKMQKKTGEIIDVSFEGCIGYDINGKFKQTYCTFKDVTLEKKFKSELIKAKEKAEESDKLKTAFLANMSHEIRTPMNGILGFTSLLKEENVPKDKQKKYINIIEESGNRLLGIINDLIDFSKIESNQMEVNKSSFSINNKMKYFHDFFSRELTNKDVQINLSFGLNDEESVIFCDMEKFDAILSNLLKNAVKFTKTGSISFGYHKKENQLEFFVEDTGCGISEEFKPRIFDRFVKQESEINIINKGAGLGLAISKGYVQLLNGDIWFESEEGKGSKFIFNLPYTIRESSSLEQKPIIDKLPEISGSGTILIAEDDTNSRLYLEAILSDQNYKVIQYPNGEDLVNAVKSGIQADLILMDLKMPKMNGFEATKRIRYIDQDIPIIAQTAYAIIGDEKKARDAGCNDYISKPINRIELIKKINTLIGK